MMISLDKYGELVKDQLLVDINIAAAAFGLKLNETKTRVIQNESFVIAGMNYEYANGIYRLVR